MDDDPDTVTLSAALLTANGSDDGATYDPNAALATAPVFRPDVLLTDVAMPGMLGIELACKVVEAVPTWRIVFPAGGARLIGDFGLAGGLQSGVHVAILADASGQDARLLSFCSRDWREQ